MADPDLVAVVEAAWADGCPVAGAEQERIAEVARRRWASQPRRLPPDADHQRRVEDLAKGLLAAFEPDRHLVGPLIEDYRHLARIVAATYSPRFGLGFGGVAGRTAECDAGEAVAHIVIGDWDELMCVPLDHWHREAYERQWRQAFEAIVGREAERHALLTAVHDPATAVFFVWWPIWRLGGRVVLGNGLAHEDDHDLADLLEDPAAHVPDLAEWSRPAGSGEPRPSLWEIDAADLFARHVSGGL
ncbi:MAG TPA: hypothetical protein VF228_05415 [Iamia sp.]